MGANTGCKGPAARFLFPRLLWGDPHVPSTDARAQFEEEQPSCSSAKASSATSKGTPHRRLLKRMPPPRGHGCATRGRTPLARIGHGWRRAL